MIGQERRLPACAETCHSPFCKLNGSSSPPGADFVVVGAGVIGLSVAYHLAKQGAGVAVVERGRVGGQASGAAAGMLAPLSEAHGPGPFFDLAMAGLAVFPEFAAELHDESGIGVEYLTSGLLRVAMDEEGEAALRERVAWQRSAGFAVDLLDGRAACEAEPGLNPAVRAAAWYPAEHHVYSPRFVRALAAAAARRGVRFVEGAEVAEFVTAGGRVAGVRVAGSGLEFEEINAGHVVIAAGAWSAQLGRRLGVELPVFPCRGQILALRPKTPSFRRIVFTDGGYALTKADGTVVVGATEEPAGFDNRVTASGLAYLTRMAATLSPELSEAAFRHVWSGLRPGSADTLPVIGRLPGWEGVSVATGHYRNGILLSVITGRLVAALLAGGEAPSAGPGGPVGAGGLGGVHGSISLSAFDPARFRKARAAS